MPTDTVEWYKDQMGLPLYLSMSTDEFNHYRHGETYNIRVPDEDGDESDQPGGPYNHVHEALCLGTFDANKLEDYPPLLVAFAAETNSLDEARERWKKYIESDQSLRLVLFMRLDKAKEFALGGMGAVDVESSGKELAEDGDVSGRQK